MIGLEILIWIVLKTYDKMAQTWDGQTDRKSYIFRWVPRLQPKCLLLQYLGPSGHLN